MACTNNKLVVKIQSGEVRSFGFTVKNKSELQQPDGSYYTPMDLTEYLVDFQIKEYPYASVTPIIHKVLDLEEDSDNGWIYDPTKGKFEVVITLDDMDILIPGKEYNLVITLINGDTRIIISGEGDNVGIFMVCNS